jgi:hypothetical protein
MAGALCGKKFTILLFKKNPKENGFFGKLPKKKVRFEGLGVIF